MEAGSKIAGNNHSALQFGIDDVIVHGIFIIVDMSSDIVVVAEGFCQRHDLRIGIVKFQSKPDIYRIHVDTVHINQRQQRRQDEGNHNAAGIADDLQKFFFDKGR